MKTNFDASLQRLLVHEGGYVNHPSDPGGETNMGVTKRTYDAYRRGLDLPVRSVKMISMAEVGDIYRKQYWDKVDGDFLPVGLDYVMLDGAANSGPSQAIKWLQRALGDKYKGQVDGMMGQMTHDGINLYRNIDRLIAAILERRLAFMQSLKTWKTFGKGWSARVTSVRKTGQAWAHGDVGPAVVFVPSGREKARLSDAKTIPSTGAADGLVGLGMGTGGAGAAVNEARDALLPYADSSSLARKVVIVLVVAGAAITVGGAVYRFYNKRKADKLRDALDLGVAA